MSAMAAEYRRRPAAWPPRDHWRMLALEGLGLLVLGFGLGRSFSSAGDAGRFLCAIGLLAVCIERIAAGRRTRDGARARLETSRGAIVVVAALPALLSPWLTAIAPERAWHSLAAGLVLLGALGLVGFAAPAPADAEPARLRATLWDVVAIGAGAALLAAVDPETLAGEVDWGTAFVGLGIVRLGEAVSRWRRTRRSP